MYLATILEAIPNALISLFGHNFMVEIPCGSFICPFLIGMYFFPVLTPPLSHCGELISINNLIMEMFEFFFPAQLFLLDSLLHYIIFSSKQSREMVNMMKMFILDNLLT